ncbi:aminotransferase class V-fold PLP-dependent enzyme [Defluviimonas sp. WL0024]|uniref:Aminotransferase class V-fold PLP-dependent enzyme n=1 Tax=Albidovulum salinarum TaxID=2984153 RepID=A0ABT2X9C5_9RHOB|nr:aminotransferase class V-fold PLP-dependent enzyme [Defluviimonas sp. WL0024]MCU9850546.1 aminotransferase class V-fold PLP-dependent enzyme [Defluviimonas sp. WL0024]
MVHALAHLAPSDVLTRAAAYARDYRSGNHPISPSASSAALRERFCLPVTDDGLPGARVIDELIAAAEPGLVGNTSPNFYAWVMGASDPVGVAADWLTSAWGQNAAIYQSSPAAATAEEAVEAWLLELLDLPRDSSVGFVGGATMAAFVGLAAARGEVLRRGGYDIDAEGLQGAPKVHIFISDDAHVTNYAALRQLGFGETNFHKLPSDGAGLLCPDDLAVAMARVQGPKIIVAQAGHINSGGFEPLAEIAALARLHDAWMHVDGAFGLWVRASTTRKHLAMGAELADSWSVDGHKWLQLPYESGFAIVRNKIAHQRAMQKSAGYLNAAEEDGRNPSAFTPGLSRRAQGFAAWAVLRRLGRNGVATLVDRHCDAASRLARRISRVGGLEVLNRMDLNQIVVGCHSLSNESWKITALAERLNAGRCVFVRTALWKGRTVLRLSVISQDSEARHVETLAELIEGIWPEIETEVENMGALTLPVSSGMFQDGSTLSDTARFQASTTK